MKFMPSMTLQIEKKVLASDLSSHHTNIPLIVEERVPVLFTQYILRTVSLYVAKKMKVARSPEYVTIYGFFKMILMFPQNSHEPLL